jgi:catalase
MVAGLRNVHTELAQYVGDGLGLADLPEPTAPAREPRTDLPPSPALSIVRNGPESFAGRKVGVLITDGADAATLTAVRSAVEREQAVLEFVAPAIGSVSASDGSVIAVGKQLNGTPSVLYDAVVLAVSLDGARLLAGSPAARDFVSDAYAHAKFIAFTSDSLTLLAAGGVGEELDDGCTEISAETAGDFITQCRQLRYWPREEAMTR